MRRFTGSVAPFALVDVRALVAWINAISLDCWPQQSKTELKPAMVTDLNWFGFGTVAAPLVTMLMTYFPDCQPYNRMVSAVMPGHCIEAHKDQQANDWLCRVHCPLLSNDQSRFIVAGIERPMKVGLAYRVNTLAEHSVTNDGTTPRVHLMFDVRGGT